MSALFQKVEGETAILRQNGVYKEADLYVRLEGELYAKAAGGFVRLYADGATSKSGVSLDTLTIDQVLYKDRIGKLCLYPAAGRTAIAETPTYVRLEDKS